MKLGAYKKLPENSFPQEQLEEGIKTLEYFSE